MSGGVSRFLFSIPQERNHMKDAPVAKILSRILIQQTLPFGSVTDLARSMSRRIDEHTEGSKSLRENIAGKRPPHAFVAPVTNKRARRHRLFSLCPRLIEYNHVREPAQCRFVPSAIFSDNHVRTLRIALHDSLYFAQIVFG